MEKAHCVKEPGKHRTFKLARTRDAKACIHRVLRRESAVSNLRRHEPYRAKKEELKQYFQLLQFQMR